MKLTLDITPQTWVRINAGKHGDQVLFKIPENCEKGTDDEGELTGLPCEDYLRDGECRHCLSKHSRARKRRIERYNKYRTDLFFIAKKAGFELPTCGWSLYFYFPVPKRWSKRKKIEMHGQLHLQKPDESNLLKAFEDSISVSDENIAQMSGLGKFWVNQDRGYIEIITDQPLYNPFGVTFIDQFRKVSMTALEERRKAKEARKAELKEMAKQEKAKPKKVKPLRIADEKLFKKKDELK